MSPPSRNQILRMVLLACVLLSGLSQAQIDPGPTDRIQMVPSGNLFSFSWSDTDDTLHGTISPTPLAKGHAFTVTLKLEPLTGPAYDLPVVLTLRKVGEEYGVTQVVKRTKAGWSASFTPDGDGPYWLDVAFRTTHAKALHAGLSIRSSGVPLWAWGAFALVVAALAASFWRGRRQEVRPAPDTAP